MKIFPNFLMMFFKLCFTKNNLERSIGLNAMSTCLGFFYALRLGNCVHYMFIFTFFV